MKCYKSYFADFNPNKSKFEVYMLSGKCSSEIFCQIWGANRGSIDDT